MRQLEYLDHESRIVDGAATRTWAAKARRPARWYRYDTGIAWADNAALALESLLKGSMNRYVTVSATAPVQHVMYATFRKGAAPAVHAVRLVENDATHKLVSTQLSLARRLLRARYETAFGHRLGTDAISDVQAGALAIRLDLETLIPEMKGR